MIVTDIVLAFCVAILFAVFVKQCVRIERCEDNMGMSEAEIQELRRRCDTYRELIEALSKSVRELNGVVEEAVKSKEPAPDNKPDMSALIGGWTTETTWLDDILAKIRKEKEKLTDKYCVSIALDNGESLVLDLHDTGRILMNQGKPVKSYGKGRFYTDDEGNIYELPEGCSILGDTPYEMDQ